MASRRSGKTARDAFEDTLMITPEDADRRLYGYGDPESFKQAEDAQVHIIPVQPSDLTIDPAIQVRIKNNPARVEELTQVLLNGGTFKDPIRAFRDEDGKLWLSAGFRRTLATKSALSQVDNPGLIAPLLCEVHESGGRLAALQDAEEDNLKNAETLTFEEKRGIFMRRLVRRDTWFLEGARWSNRQMAAELAVTEGTIRNWLKPFSPSLRKFTQSGKNKGEKQASQIIAKDGRKMDVSGIQEAAQKRGTPPVRSFVPEGDPAPLDAGEGVPGKLGDMRPAIPTGRFGLTGPTLAAGFSIPDAATTRYVSEGAIVRANSMEIVLVASPEMHQALTRHWIDSDRKAKIRITVEIVP
jgi:hypothetical protein